jgi:hypothetical protein
MEKVLVNHRTVAEKADYLRSSVVTVVLVVFLLFVIAAPRLRLDAGRARRLRARWGSLSGMLLSVLLFAVLGAGSAAALDRPLFQAEGQGLGISLEETFLEVKTGDEVDFDTLLENHATEDSPPVIMAMNIIKLTSTGDVVDPEDWSPERTQYVEFVPAEDELRQSWTIEAILKGDYVVYLVAVPEPGKGSTSHPSAARDSTSRSGRSSGSTAGRAPRRDRRAARRGDAAAGACPAPAPSSRSRGADARLITVDVD